MVSLARAECSLWARSACRRLKSATISILNKFLVQRRRTCVSTGSQKAEMLRGQFVVHADRERWSLLSAALGLVYAAYEI